MSLLVTKIQRSSFYDGPGIRTTVFLKGCFLSCPWCSNPENIKSYPQFYFIKEKCLKEKGFKCQECLNFYKVKEFRDISAFSESSFIKKDKDKRFFEDCPTEAFGVYGKKISIIELFEILKKDKEFYRISGGGVTFSGGEPLMQAEKLVEILRLLKKEKINTAIETSLFCPSSLLTLVQKNIDLFIVDIKILDPVKCREIIGGDINLYFHNVEKLLKEKKQCIFRFPIVKPFTYNKKNLRLLYAFLKRNKIQNLEIFNVHNLATEKYKSLNLPTPRFKKISYRELTFLVKNIKKIGTSVKVLTF